MKRLLWLLALLPFTAWAQTPQQNLAALGQALQPGGIVPCAQGGTAFTTAPANGQIPIGNGTCFTLATLTAGANIVITNSAGQIQIASTGGSGGTPGGAGYSLQFNNAGTFGGLFPVSTGAYCINWASLSSSPALTTSCPGSGGSGTVNNGTSGQMAGYAANGTAVSGFNLNNGLSSTFTSGALDLISANRTVATTTDTISCTSDLGKNVQYGNASGIAVTLPAATGSCAYGFWFSATNWSTGNVVITPSSGLINGAASLTIGANRGCKIITDNSSGSYDVEACTALVTTSGAGTVTTTGSPANGNIAVFSGSTSITNGNLSGDVTSSGTTATTVAKIAGGPLPTSANVGGWNSSSQPVAATATNVLTLLNSQTCNAQTGTTYTFVLGDAYNCVTGSNASAQTYTVPPNASVAYSVGTTLTLLQIGSGTITLGPGSGVTLQSAKYGSSTSQTYAFASQYSCLSLQQTATNTWYVSECDYPASSGGGSGTVNSGTSGQLAYYASSGTAVSGTTINSEMLAYLQASTKFTYSATGCTPSATTGGPFSGTITLAAGPCTSIVVTINGATGFTDTNGYHCTVADKTTQSAGTYIPDWTSSADNSTTATLPIPGAAGSTDVISFACTPRTL